MIWRVFFALQGLVLAHELGHFLVARLVRMPVEVVSLGMGPRLFGLRTRETDYRVSLLPIGGYVRVSGWDRGAERSPPSNVGRRTLARELAVLLAGPLASLLVPLMLFLIAHARETELPAAEVGDVEPAMPASGVLAPGDVVSRVEGASIESYWDLERALSAVHLGPRSVDVNRDGKELSLRLPGYVGRAGVLPHASRPVVAVLGPESPAYRAGLRSSDEIVAIGGQRMTRWSDVVAALVRSRGDAVQIGALRPMVSEADTNVRVYEAHVVVLTSRVLSQPLNRDYLFQPAELASRTGLVRGDLLLERVGEGSAAWLAGLRAGDILRRLCGTEVGTPAGIRLRLQQGVEGCEFVVWRRDRELSLNAPVGLKWDGTELDLAETRAPSVRFHRVPGAAYVWLHAWRDAGNTVASSARAMLAWLRGDGNGSRAGLLQRVGESVQELGGGGESGGELRLYAHLSAQLGLVNLLPLPMLDGGTLLWRLWTFVARGRPRLVSPRVKSLWDKIGWAALLFALCGLLLRELAFPG